MRRLLRGRAVTPDDRRRGVRLGCRAGRADEWQDRRSGGRGFVGLVRESLCFLSLAELIELEIVPQSAKAGVAGMAEEGGP